MRTIDPSIMLAAMAMVRIAPTPSPAQILRRARRVSYAPMTPPAIQRSN